MKIINSMASDFKLGNFPNGRLIVLVLVSALGHASLATSSELYCGTINTQKPLPIIFDLSKRRYFYRKHKKIIPLSVIKNSNNELIAAEKIKDSQAQFHLFKKACPAYEIECVELSGYWQKDKVRYPVNLKPINLDGEGQISFEDIRDGIKTQIISKGTTEVKQGTMGVRNLEIEYTITKYKDTSKIPALNKLITRYHKYLDDDPCEDITTSANYNSEHNFSLITEDLLSIGHRMWGMAPGMAYPLNGEGGEEYYDLVNQKQLDVDYIFRDFKKNRQEIIEIFFKRKIDKSKRLAEKYKLDEDNLFIDKDGNYIKDDDEDNVGCLGEYAGTEIFKEDSFGIHLDTEKKLLGLARTFPRYLRPCWDDFQYLKTSEFEKYLNIETELYSYLTGQKAISQKSQDEGLLSWFANLHYKAQEFFKNIISFIECRIRSAYK